PTREHAPRPRGRCGRCAASSQSLPAICTRSPFLVAAISLPNPDCFALLFDCPADLLGDVGDGQIAIDLDQTSLGPVVIGYWLGLKFIGRKPFANHFLAIIVTNHQLETINITDFINAGWLKVDIIDVSSGTSPTSGQSPQ